MQVEYLHCVAFGSLERWIQKGEMPARSANQHQHQEGTSIGEIEQPRCNANKHQHQSKGYVYR